MGIPSQAREHPREGVEARRAAPVARSRYGEGMVQTTNPGAARGRRKPRWYENPCPFGEWGFESPRPHFLQKLPLFLKDLVTLLAGRICGHTYTGWTM